jgi:hypothetical protein
MTLFHPASNKSFNPLLDLKKNKDNPEDISVEKLINEFSITKYKDTKYFGLNQVEIISSGYDYNIETSAVLPEPDKENGKIATAKILFGLTKKSINITGGKNNLKDIYIIYPENYLENNEEFEPAVISVSEVDVNGSVLSFNILENGYGFNNSLGEIFYFNSSENILNYSAQISIVPNKFSISKILITDGGSGYSRNIDSYNKYKIQFINTGYGYGCYSLASCDPIINYDSKEDFLKINSIKYPIESNLESFSVLSDSISPQLPANCVSPEILTREVMLSFPLDIGHKLANPDDFTRVIMQFNKGVDKAIEKLIELEFTEQSILTDKSRPIDVKNKIRIKIYAEFTKKIIEELDLVSKKFGVSRGFIVSQWLLIYHSKLAGKYLANGILSLSTTSPDKIVNIFVKLQQKGLKIVKMDPKLARAKILLIQKNVFTTIRNILLSLLEESKTSSIGPNGTIIIGGKAHIKCPKNNSGKFRGKPGFLMIPIVFVYSFWESETFAEGIVSSVINLAGSLDPIPYGTLDFDDEFTTDELLRQYVKSYYFGKLTLEELKNTIKNLFNNNIKNIEELFPEGIDKYIEDTIEDLIESDQLLQEEIIKLNLQLESIFDRSKIEYIIEKFSEDVKKLTEKDLEKFIEDLENSGMIKCPDDCIEDPYYNIYD